MTEAVQLAVIAMLHAWGISLLENWSSILGAVVAFLGFWYARKSVKVTEEKSTEIATTAEAARLVAVESKDQIQRQVCDVRDQLASIQFTKDEIETIMKGRERQLAEKFIAVGREQVSGPAPLQSNFDPMGTDFIDVTKG